MKCPKPWASTQWKSGRQCYKHLGDRNNLHDNGYSRFFYSHSVKCIEFLIEQHAFREDMSYAPAKEFDDAEDHIYAEVKLSDWCWNKQVR